LNINSIIQDYRTFYFYFWVFNQPPLYWHILKVQHSMIKLLKLYISCSWFWLGIFLVSFIYVYCVNVKCHIKNVSESLWTSALSICEVGTNVGPYIWECLFMKTFLT
jgi:hypothetical protein